MKAHDPLAYYQRLRVQAQVELSIESRPHWRAAHEATIAACDVELAAIVGTGPVPVELPPAAPRPSRWATLWGRAS